MDNLKCSKCQNDHHTALCVSNDNTTAGVAILKVTDDEDLNSAILPTFHVKKNNEKYRSLIDTGCQANFVREDLVKKFDMKILRNRVPLSINGINNSKSYVIKEVEGKINIGKKEVCMKFFTLPKIDITVTVPGLRDIAEMVSQLGLNLADDQLLKKGTDILDNFYFIFGIKDFSKIKLKPAYIGNACLWEIDGEIVLFGDTDELDMEISRMLSIVKPEIDE